LDFGVKWGNGPTARLQKDLLALVLANRVALFAEWEQKVCTQK